MNKVAISVDIEDWYHGPAVTGSSFATYPSLDAFGQAHPFQFDKLQKYIHRILEMLSEHQQKATFFIVGDLARRCPAIVKDILAYPHEIACHGLYHRSKFDPKTQQMRVSNEEFKAMTLESRKILQDLSGQAINGYRAPSAYISGEMIDCLEEIGFLYDSSVSVNSIYRKGHGSLEGVTTAPYQPAYGKLSKGTANKRKIVEFPWPYLSLGPIKMPTAGGPFLRFFGAHYLAYGIEESLKRGHTGFYFHAIDISNEKFPSLGKHRPFYFAIKGKMVEQKIQYLIRRFKPQLATYQDLLEQPS